MTQTIDPIKLKAAAEHLEWVCQQYPDKKDVHDLYQGLLPMIEDAKAGRVLKSVDRVPYSYSFADGVYDAYIDPSVTDAYYGFSIEFNGGLSDKAKAFIAEFEASEIAEKEAAQS